MHLQQPISACNTRVNVNLELKSKCTVPGDFIKFKCCDDVNTIPGWVLFEAKYY